MPRRCCAKGKEGTMEQTWNQKGRAVATPTGAEAAGSTSVGTVGDGHRPSRRGQGRWLWCVLLLLAALCGSGAVLAQPLELDGQVLLRSVASCDTNRIGVALSGGGAMGYAHLGFLQAMDEAGIRVDCISGTSMGAIIGMFYAAGYTPREIVAIAKKERMNRFKTIFRSNHRIDGGYSDYYKLRQVFLRYVPHDSFDSLKIPFYCCVADMNFIKPKYVGRGPNLRHYVTASASIPLAFVPVRIDSVYYVDGGVLDNLPAAPLFVERCGVRIGVYISHDSVSPTIDDPKRVWARAYSIYSNANTHNKLPLCTHTVSIDPHGYNLTHFSKLDDFFDYGYEAGRRFVEAHPELRRRSRVDAQPEELLRSLLPANSFEHHETESEK